MDKILAPIKQRILLFIDSQGITKKYFFESLKISASNFRSNGLYSEIGGDVLAKILSEYNQLNTEWLLTGKGQMLKSNKEGIVINKQEDVQEIQEELVRAYKIIEDRDIAVQLYKKNEMLSVKVIHGLQPEEENLKKEIEALKKAQQPKEDYRHSVKSSND